MKKLFLLFVIAGNFCQAQLTNNCATTNFLTKRDSSGNLACSSIKDEGFGITIGSGSGAYAWPSLTLNNHMYISNYPSSTLEAFTYYQNGNKDSYTSCWWGLGNTASVGAFAPNGFSLIETKLDEEGTMERYVRMFFKDVTGQVAIGTTTLPTDTSYKLAVAGKIIAEELKVQLQGQWPDYVFTKDYKLPTLAEVEKQIEEKGHLAGVPSACEVEENGLELGDMAKIQQQKIEELTLYIIELNKKLEAQDRKLQALEAKSGN